MRIRDEAIAESGLFEKQTILAPHHLTGFLFTGLLFFILYVLGTVAYAYDVTLAWDPNDEPDLAGYIVYVNEDASGTPFYQLDAVSMDEIEPDNPRYTVTELKNDVDYCFVVTAYAAEGSESDYSNTVCVLDGWVHDSRDVSLNVSQGGGSAGCFIIDCQQ